jgi:S-adenosylmethionine hydrolase
MIVLMTDFGESEYVGVMKGVILSIAPGTHIIDLTHSISPQAVREGAWVLLQNYHYFPHDTRFVCVVDPGVGTDRDSVLVYTKNYGIRQIFSLTIGEDASRTFHGRDVFAVAAANLENQTIGKHLGPSKNALDIKLVFHQEGREGEVVRVDRFGNIVTNIPPLGLGPVKLRTNDIDRDLVHYSTYAEGLEDEIFVVTGSSTTLEISARNARASDSIPLRVGDRLTIE